MFGSELRLWITSLLPAEAVGLIRSLLLAEANRLRCETGAVRMSGNLTAPDAGVDARTHFPEGSESIFPIGPCTWQVKAGQSGEPNITAELAKAGVKHDIEQGRRYVLAWTQDPAATSTLEERLEAAVGEQGGEGVLARAEDVERFCRGASRSRSGIGRAITLRSRHVRMGSDLRPGFVSVRHRRTAGCARRAG